MFRLLSRSGLVDFFQARVLLLYICDDDVKSEAVISDSEEVQVPSEVESDSDSAIYSDISEDSSDSSISTQGKAVKKNKKKADEKKDTETPQAQRRNTDA
ncbi:hypothetical protein V493_04504 [Pseudogymnoascus sp. VKM F-4281 (FW-2241)]|nr:hypothetical protein V493_04504 [Pseudogymnoascus sp. VKM F-4281 (FW-2241)]